MTEKTPTKTEERSGRLGIVSILSAIAEEAGALAKSRESGGVPFAFRGIDAVVNHLAPKLDKYGVIQTATVLDKITTVRELNGGKAITQTDITVRYTFYAPDGSSISTEAAGLAQDYADRSAAQAQSVAYRTALLQLFHLPTTDKEPEEAGEDTQRFIEKNAATTKKDSEKKEDAASIRAEMGALLESSGGLLTGDDANAIMAEIAPGKEPSAWTATELKKGHEKLKAKLEGLKAAS